MIHDIDKQRFKFLLQVGLRPDDAKTFLKENKIQLIRLGEPLDNVPSDPRAIHRLIEGFDSKANLLFGKWLQNRYKSTNPFPISQLILRWRGAEELGISYEESESTTLCQQTLCGILVAEPDEMLLAFLRTPIAKPDSNRITIDSEEWLSLTTALLAKERATEAPGWINAVVDIVNAVTRFDATSLSPSAPYADVLSEIQSAIESSRPVVVSPSQSLPVELPRGVQGHGPELRSFDPNFEYTDCTVIATKRTARDALSILLFVEGFVDDKGIVFQLSDNDLKKAIPTIGRIILHPEQYDTPPLFGEPNAYSVESFPTENKAKVKVARRIPDALIPVVSMPFASVDAHRIRDYITNYARENLKSTAVFVSADKLCLVPRVAVLQKVLAPEFDWQLDLWDTLESVEFQNGPYVLRSGLRQAQKSLNCEPLSDAARKLLRIYTERSQVKLTKASRDQLFELMDRDDLRFEEATKERLKVNLDVISSGTDAYNQLVDSLLKAQSIREEIERRINAEVSLKIAERDKTKREVEQLRSQRTQLERRIADLSAEAESEASAVRVAVSRAFQHARDNGFDTLAEMAVFDVLLKREGAATQLASMTTAAQAIETVVNKSFVEMLAASGKQVRDVFRRFGMEESLSDRLAAVLHLARLGGSPIVVSGTGASALGVALGQALCQSKCVSVTLSLGAITDEHFEKLVADSNAEALILRQGNVSELSLCARTLLDEVVMRMMSQSSEPPFALVLIDARGAAALPWPSEILEAAVGIDLDAIKVQLEVAPSVENSDLSWLRRRMFDHFARLADDQSVSPDTLQDLQRLRVTFT